jgi:hypothetical protein
VHYRVVVGFRYIIAFLINKMAFYMVLYDLLTFFLPDISLFQVVLWWVLT